MDLVVVGERNFQLLAFYVLTQEQSKEAYETSDFFGYACDQDSIPTFNYFDELQKAIIENNWKIINTFVVDAY